MSDTIKDFQARYETLSADEKLKDVSGGAKALVAAVTLILDRLPRFHTIIDETAKQAQSVPQVQNPPTTPSAP